MRAFYRDNDLLVKAYDQGENWQLIDNYLHERWFSKWSNDVHGSLIRAFESTVKNFNQDNLVLNNESPKMSDFIL
jgi:hypothetical protein